MFDRLKAAVSAFRHVWKHYNPKTPWTDTFYAWQIHENGFKIGDFDYIKGRTYKRPEWDIWGEKNVLPNGIEPFMLKKHVVDKEGRARYFNVIPEGYDPVVYKSSWED